MTYQERWEAAADTPLTVYVPVAGAVLDIAPESGIVGQPSADGSHIQIYYEGNIYDALDLRSWSARVRTAAARLVTRYPTVARATVPAALLIPVGTYVPRTHGLHLTNLDALAAWLPVPPV